MRVAHTVRTTDGMRFESAPANDATSRWRLRDAAMNQMPVVHLPGPGARRMDAAAPLIGASAAQLIATNGPAARRLRS